MSGHSDDIRFATFSADGRRIISASHDGTARLWDARTGEEVFVLPKQGPLWSAALSPDGESLVTASSDGTARIWNSKNSFAPVVFGGHTDTVLRVALSPDETRVVTASEDKTAKVFDARTGAPKLTLVGHQGQVSSATFSPDATQIATASWDNTARLWDAKTGALRLTLSGHESFVTDVAFSPDGKRLATASYDNSFRIWDANSGSPLATCRGDKGHLRGITFSPDGTRIVSSPDDRMAQIWDAKTCDLVLTLKVPMAGISTGVYSAAFSSDGRRIVTASNDRTARIWDAFSGAPLGEPLYHPLDMDGGGVGVSGAAFSPDGRRVLTTTKHSLRLWDLETRTVVAEVPGTGSNSSAGAVLDGQGMHVLSPSYGKTARLWRIFPNTQALVEQAKSSVPRCLTPDERKKYFLDPDPPIWCIEMQKWPYQDTPLPPPWHIRVFERAKTWLFPAKKNDLRWIDPTRSF